MKLLKRFTGLTLCVLGIILFLFFDTQRIFAQNAAFSQNVSQTTASNSENIGNVQGGGTSSISTENHSYAEPSNAASDIEVAFHQDMAQGFDASVDSPPTALQNFTVSFWLKEHYWTVEDPITAGTIDGEIRYKDTETVFATFKKAGAITYNAGTKKWSVPFLCPLLSPNQYLVINLSNTATDKTDIATYSDIPTCVNVAFSTPTSQVYCDTTLAFTVRLKEGYSTFGIKKLWLHYDSIYDDTIHDDEIPISASGSYSLTLPWAYQIDVGCEAGPIVKFNVNGGSPAPNEQIVPLNEPDEALVTKPTDPTRLGYTFTGWFTDAACTAKFDFATPLTEQTTSPLLLYAGWLEDHFTVSFDCNDAIYTGTKPAAQNCYISANEGRATKPEITQTGYTFGGWYTDSACTAGNEWNFNNRVTQDMTLYAKWSEDHFTVSFDCDDAIYTGTKPAAQNCYISVNEGRATKPEITQTGYTFGGWYTDSACTAGNEWNFNNRVTQDMTLYAKWSEDHFTVSFDCNDAIYTGTKPAAQNCCISVNEGRATKPEITQTGYTFGGWYTDSACTAGNEWNFNNRVTQDMTLYAKWSANITLGHSDFGQIESTPRGFADFNTIVTITQQPYTGYVSGLPLVKDVNGAQIPVDYVSENTVRFIIGQLPVTITPVFEREICVVSFDTQGGLPQPGNTAVEWGSPVENAPERPTLAHYEFLGWFTQPQGGDLFHFGQGGTIVTQNITLYAHWQQSGDGGNTPDITPDITPGDTPENTSGNIQESALENSALSSTTEDSSNSSAPFGGSAVEKLEELARNIGGWLSTNGMLWFWIPVGALVSVGLILCLWGFFFAKKKKKDSAS